MMENLTPPDPDALLRVRTPCPKRWDDLTGGDARRYCAHCDKHVHNLSVLGVRETRQLALAAGRGERVCVAYHAAPDGSVQRTTTSRRRLRTAWAMLRSLLALILPWTATEVWAGKPADASTTGGQPGQHRGAARDADGGIILGKIAVPKPEPTPVPTPTPRSASRDAEGAVMLGSPLPPSSPTPKPTPVPTPTPRPPEMLIGEVCLPTPTPPPTPKK